MHKKLSKSHVCLLTELLSYRRPRFVKPEFGGDRASMSPIMFSKRGAFDLAPNAIARAAAARPPTHDLTPSNPTRVDLVFDDEALLFALRGVVPTVYDPEPRGLAPARAALGELLGWNPDRLVLTGTTSDAYSFLIKLFCDPGDRILIPEPSYPLLQMLARLEGAVAVPYASRYDGDWHIDRAAFLDHLAERPKLIIAVSPNNPTGGFLCADDLGFLLSHGLPVIVDEVFAAYDLRREQPSALTHAKTRSGLLFALGGLSKAAALPQLKLSWIAVSGDESQVDRALPQLDLVTDTYLSVNDLTQRALRPLLAASVGRRRLVFERLQENRRSAVRLLQDAPEISALPVRGGWYQVLRLPKTRSEEDWALDFLERGVLVQPGWFYDFPDEPWIVISLLTPPSTLTEGLQRIIESVVSASR
jgi:aspartate/methionine/tyrosine aminotransferase